MLLIIHLVRKKNINTNLASKKKKCVLFFFFWVGGAQMLV